MCILSNVMYRAWLFYERLVANGLKFPLGPDLFQFMAGVEEALVDDDCNNTVDIGKEYEVVFYVIHFVWFT